MSQINESTQGAVVGGADRPSIDELTFLLKACLRCRARLVPRGGDIPGARTCAPRGLCWPCYRLVRRDGTLTDYPRCGRPRAELLAEYADLRDRGYDRREIPRLLGMTEGAVERALQRARASGMEVA